jgi:hypothetical protein
VLVGLNFVELDEDEEVNLEWLGRSRVSQNRESKVKLDNSSRKIYHHVEKGNIGSRGKFEFA